MPGSQRAARRAVLYRRLAVQISQRLKAEARPTQTQTTAGPPRNVLASRGLRRRALSRSRRWGHTWQSVRDSERASAHPPHARQAQRCGSGRRGSDGERRASDRGEAKHKKITCHAFFVSSYAETRLLRAHPPVTKPTLLLAQQLHLQSWYTKMPNASSVVVGLARQPEGVQF